MKKWMTGAIVVLLAGWVLWVARSGPTKKRLPPETIAKAAQQIRAGEARSSGPELSLPQMAQVAEALGEFLIQCDLEGGYAQDLRSVRINQSVYYRVPAPEGVARIVEFGEGRYNVVGALRWEGVTKDAPVACVIERRMVNITGTLKGIDDHQVHVCGHFFPLDDHGDFSARVVANAPCEGYAEGAVLLPKPVWFEEGDHVVFRGDPDVVKPGLVTLLLRQLSRRLEQYSPGEYQRAYEASEDLDPAVQEWFAEAAAREIARSSSRD